MTACVSRAGAASRPGQGLVHRGAWPVPEGDRKALCRAPTGPRVGARRQLRSVRRREEVRGRNVFRDGAQGGVVARELAQRWHGAEQLDHAPFLALAGRRDEQASLVAGIADGDPGKGVLGVGEAQLQAPGDELRFVRQRTRVRVDIDLQDAPSRDWRHAHPWQQVLMGDGPGGR